MSDHDLLLDDTLTTIVTDGADVLVELVADGIMWRGTPVPGSSWAGGLPRRQDERTPLRDRLAVSGYLHLDRACYRLGERWAPAGRVRLRLDSVSAWWIRSAPPDSATDRADGSELLRAPGTTGTAAPAKPATPAVNVEAAR